MKYGVTIDGLRALAAGVHEQNVKAGWWNDLQTGEDLRHTTPGPKRNVPEMLCLIHSEVSEALEGYRKGLPDPHLPHRSNVEVELADALIRILDCAEGMGLDIAGAVADKLAYNANRADHMVENRKKAGGKAI